LLTEFKLTPSLINNGANGPSNPFSSAPLMLPAVPFAPPFSAVNGVHVASADLNNDGFGDLLLGGGPGNGSLLAAFLTNLGGTTTQGTSANVFSSNVNDVFVAGAPI
jgi:hypothetical protein